MKRLVLKRLVSLSSALFLAGSLLVVACGGEGSSESQLRVERGTVSSVVLLSGSLRASKSLDLTSPPGEWGLAIRWLIEDGSSVKKGDKVVELDSSALVNQVASLRSAYVSARNEELSELERRKKAVAEKKHEVDQARIALEKASVDADVDPSSLPRRTYEDLQLAKKEAEGALQSAKNANVAESRIGAAVLKQKEVERRKAERKLKQVLDKLDLYVLHAPADGIAVVGKSWQSGGPLLSGDKVFSGQTLVSLPDLSTMEVDAQLVDVDDRKIHEGQSVRCFLDAYPERVFPGKVISLSPVARTPDRKSQKRVFDVVIQLEKTDPEIMQPGMSVRVEVPRDSGDSLLVPRSALTRADKDAEQRGFVVVSAGKQVPVDVLLCNDSHCAVRSDALSEGMAVERQI